MVYHCCISLVLKFLRKNIATYVFKQPHTKVTVLLLIHFPAIEEAAAHENRYAYRYRSVPGNPFSPHPPVSYYIQQSLNCSIIMPAITSGKVLVTGANGYIAIWVVQALLNQGFSVRGTVRSESKAGHLREVFKSFGDKLEIVVVQDITKDGAFDEAVKGVDAIEHTASPFHFHAVEPDELIIPAVQGTTSVLKSALKHGSSVRRVVVLSSCAAVLNPSTEPHVFNETNWNEGSLQEVREKGKDASPLAKYRTSKTLAEKVAWEFYEKNKSAVEWDLVVLNPPFVFGPILHAVDVPENLNSSMNDWYTTIIQGKMDKESLAKMGSSWVDVRDLAEAHVLAITKPEAAGQRLIISAGPYKWQDWVSAARRISKDIPQGNDSYNPAEAVHMIAYETTKADSVLGVKYRGIDQSTEDMLADLKAKGWWGN